MQRTPKLDELRKRYIAAQKQADDAKEEFYDARRGENRQLFRCNDHEDYQEFPDQPWRGPK